MTLMGNALSATVLVVDTSGAVLVVRRGAGWELPAGDVRVGEAVVEAAARVVLEGTGVSVGTPVMEGLDSAGEFSVVLRAKPVGGNVLEGARWVAPGEVEAVGLSARALDLVRSAC
ncbi:NUDIX domain-containing protein [Actinokineospora bangkokensis]|uniref:Nudix hydrolase domain-containing protein n=1 Tax=Actinokineospora bangkokensis TaxID=1193682 RepID=A0A1Q9LC33_9PSEU|nr:NUDIX hydrolase [Actinokineospora bangkokensis]OLR89580.1 hypothetical protein BJP25_05790 [Actinokineospora bangkokensis]